MRRLLLVAALALVATAAGAKGLTVSFDRAKELLLANKERVWKDPDSVKNASIGQPFVCPGGGTCVCIQANARNAYGGYSGLRLYGVEFTSENSFYSIGALGPYIKCGTMVPFPEMNGR